MGASTDSHEPRARYVVWWYRLSLLSAFTFFAALELILLLGARDAGGRVFIGVSLLVVVGFAARATRMGVLDLNDEGVVVYGLWRTRRLSWASIDEVGVTRGSSASLLPFHVPFFKLSDGSLIRAQEVRSLRTPSIVDEIVAAVIARLGREDDVSNT
jgi:hypothetical protein